MIVLIYFIFDFNQAKAHLIKSMDNFIKEKILLAGEAISKTYAIQKVQDNDVIVTYARYLYRNWHSLLCCLIFIQTQLFCIFLHLSSSLIIRILKDAYDVGRKFRVIVVDSRPKNEGERSQWNFAVVFNCLNPRQSTMIKGQVLADLRGKGLKAVYL